MHPDYWRQMDFYDPAKNNHHVLVVGAGSIGSYVTFCLARMGVKKITVVDFDTVSSHNLPNQFFSEALSTSEALLKTVVLKETIKLMIPSMDIEIKPVSYNEFIADQNSPSFAAIFVCVDQMLAREQIYKTETRMKTPLLIDVRAGGLFGNIYSIYLPSTNASRYYGNSLYKDSDVKPLPCTGTTIVDITMILAGMAVSRFRQYFAPGNTRKSIHTFYDGVRGTSDIFWQSIHNAGTEIDASDKTIEEASKIGGGNNEQQ